MKHINLVGYRPPWKPRHATGHGGRCIVCRAPATHSETHDRPTLTVRPGGMSRGTEPETLYYCSEHTGIAE